MGPQFASPPPPLLPRSLSKLPFQMLSESPTGTSVSSSPASYLWLLPVHPSVLAPSCRHPHQTPCLPPAADRHVTRDTPVHHLKGTFMEIFKVQETSKRATCRVLEPWHDKTTVDVSQETREVVWYSHPFKNFPYIAVIHTVRGFSVVSKASDIMRDNKC